VSEAAGKVFAVPDYESDDPGKFFPEIIKIRAHRGTRAAVMDLARRKKSRPAEVMRQLLVAGLEQEGVSL
jgi:hypothetical protein